MHRRLNPKIREVAPHYQWPRAHGFKTPVMILERPDLVERTGVTETSDEIIGLDKETGHLRGESSLECANHFTT